MGRFYFVKAYLFHIALLVQTEVFNSGVVIRGIKAVGAYRKYMSGSSIAARKSYSRAGMTARVAGAGSSTPSSRNRTGRLAHRTPALNVDSASPWGISRACS